MGNSIPLPLGAMILVGGIPVIIVGAKRVIVFLILTVPLMKGRFLSIIMVSRVALSVVLFPPLGKILPVWGRLRRVRWGLTQVRKKKILLPLNRLSFRVILLVSPVKIIRVTRMSPRLFRMVPMSLPVILIILMLRKSLKILIILKIWFPSSVPVFVVRLIAGLTVRVVSGLKILVCRLKSGRKLPTMRRWSMFLGLLIRFIRVASSLPRGIILWLRIPVFMRLTSIGVRVVRVSIMTLRRYMMSILVKRLISLTNRVPLMILPLRTLLIMVPIIIFGLTWVPFFLVVRKTLIGKGVGGRWCPRVGWARPW